MRPFANWSHQRCRSGYRRGAAAEEGSQFRTQSGSAHYGGVRGGITTGENNLFEYFFKPT